MFSEAPRRLAFLWLAFCLLMLAALAILLPRAVVNSSVLALLPSQGMGELPATLQRGFLDRLDRQMVWLVSPGKHADPTVAREWQQRLAALPALRHVQGAMSPARQQAWGAFAWQYRHALIDPATRTRLQNNTQADWVLAQLYSAFAGVGAQELQHDPLLLTRGSQLAMQQSSGRFNLRDGWLTTTDPQGRVWYFIHGELNGDSFDMHQSHVLVTQLAALKTALLDRYPDAQVLSRGTVFFSDYASAQAKHDISTLGTTTLCGVLLLIFSVFRSLRPLVLCALSVSVGALTGTVVTLLCFGQLHMMTLVMSFGIIGISADYTLYYLTERLIHGAEATPFESLHKVRRALLMALGTTAIAWLIMMLAPFPGIRQLAVLAAVGLIASCLTVICWYPLWVSGLPVRPVPALALMAAWLQHWRRHRLLRCGLPWLIVVVSAVGLLRLSINDDLTQLQSPPPVLLAQEKQIAALTGQRGDQTWFAVWGQNPQQTLERLETLAPRLATAVQKGWLTHYRLLPLSSLAQQRRDATLLQHAIPDTIARLHAAGVAVNMPTLSSVTLSPTAWLASPNSEGWRLLWLSLADGRSAVLVPVEGAGDPQALKALAASLPGVSWIDRKATFATLFAFYRLLTGVLLAAALAGIALSFILRLGLRQGVLTFLPSLLSLAAGLAALAFSGQPLNLFSLLALVLVLGIGINYTLFFSNPRGTPITTLLAVTLAMSVALLTLGMLIFSSTQAIASFGIVLCSGIFTAFLLAPLAMPVRRKQR